MSAFWERKMRTYFQRIDNNKDGILTEMDYIEIADHFSDIAKSDDTKRQHMRKLCGKVFEVISLGVSYGDPIGDIALTESVFVERFKKQLKDPKSLEHMKKVFTEVANLIFCWVDLNGDGVIEPSEYAVITASYKLDPKLAEDTFRAIDTNRDGHLSQEEFAAAFVEFMTDDDENNPARFFMGPLIPE